MVWVSSRSVAKVHSEASEARAGWLRAIKKVKTGVKSIVFKPLLLVFYWLEEKHSRMFGTIQVVIFSS